MQVEVGCRPMFEDRWAAAALQFLSRCSFFCIAVFFALQFFFAFQFCCVAVFVCVAVFCAAVFVRAANAK